MDNGPTQPWPTTTRGWVTITGHPATSAVPGGLLDTYALAMTDFTPPPTEEALARLAMPMAEAMRTQRAVRRLHTEPVDLGLLYELLELSLKAPTSSNTQDWCYVVVTGREQKQRLAKLYLPLFRTFNPIESRKTAGDEKALRQMAPGQWQAEHFADIPGFVIPCYERNLKHRPVCWPHISVSSVYGSGFP